ncbi:hypothetical protein BKA14_000780 [Actinoplanes abujensis]|uniref:Uncharacterized protein n=1 Tax=Paractinoplanes abujensis TaxID=882441 RepID=A0A7W7CLE8_9ACTN|nr:hypothetical protein [Actinoplanes abujensis]
MIECLQLAFSMRKNIRMERQLSLFSRSETAAMRDRTAARNYSPSKDKFRREHKRRRDWGLRRRHADKLARIRAERPAWPDVYAASKRPSARKTPAKLATATSRRPKPSQPTPADQATQPTPAHQPTPADQATQPPPAHQPTPADQATQPAPEDQRTQPKLEDEPTQPKPAASRAAEPGGPIDPADPSGSVDSTTPADQSTRQRIGPSAPRSRFKPRVCAAGHQSACGRGGGGGACDGFLFGVAGRHGFGAPDFAGSVRNGRREGHGGLSSTGGADSAGSPVVAGVRSVGLGGCSWWIVSARGADELLWLRLVGGCGDYLMPFSGFGWLKLIILWLSFETLNHELLRRPENGRKRSPLPAADGTTLICYEPCTW